MMAWPLVGLFITGDVYALPEARTGGTPRTRDGEAIDVNPFVTVPEGILALKKRASEEERCPTGGNEGVSCRSHTLLVLS